MWTIMVCAVSAACAASEQLSRPAAIGVAVAAIEVGPSTRVVLSRDALQSAVSLSPAELRELDLLLEANVVQSEAIADSTCMAQARQAGGCIVATVLAFRRSADTVQVQIRTHGVDSLGAADARVDFMAITYTVAMVADRAAVVARRMDRQGTSAPRDLRPRPQR